MKIIKYNNCNDIDVEFENGYIRKNVSYTDFRRGSLNHIDYSKRIGEIRYNSYNSKMTVIDYKDSKKVSIQFDNGFITKTTWSAFDRGWVKSPYCKTLANAGYLGEGKYTTKDIWYNYWRAMIERVYIKNNDFHRTYKDIKVCEEWHNYQIFAKWAEENYYKIKGHKMQLDKDILYKGNKIYSPTTCVFVPNIINSLMIKADKSRGDLPIGVYWHERDQEYRAQCSAIIKGKRKNIWLGAFSNPIDAFNEYKKFKEKYIKEIADTYKNQIPYKLYEALYKYKVEITD